MPIGSSRSKFKIVKYFRLESISFDCVKGKHSHWLWKCDCGNVVSKKHSDVKRGMVKSCGCLQSEKSRETIKKAQQALFNKYPTEEDMIANICYNNYKSNAVQRNLEFCLTKEQFFKLSKQNCEYCGIEPFNKKSIKKYNQVWIANGIDRIDSNKGYTLDNCVPCCKTCNQAKSDYTFEFFKEWIKRTFTYLNSQGEY